MLQPGFTRRGFLNTGIGAGLGLTLPLGTIASATGAPDAAATNIDLTPTSPGYEAARQPFNATILLRPARIARCRSEAEVVAAVKRAIAGNLPIAVKSGGHGFHGDSLNEGGMVIEVSGMTQPTLDGECFTSGPGLKLRDCYHWLAAKGRLLPAGSCGSVGLSGLTLGGGYGLFSREFGLTCDHLQHVRLVDGQGDLRDSRDEPELLWACRGGGNGNFGVVTSLGFATRPLPPQLATQRFTLKCGSATAAAKALLDWFAVADALPEPCFSAVVMNEAQLTVLLTSTRNAAGPAFQQAVKALTQQGYRSKGPLTQEFLKAIARFEGRQGPLPFDNVSAGFYRGADDLTTIAVGIAETARETPGLIFQVNTLGGAIARGPDSAYRHRAYPYLGELQAYWKKGPIPEKLRIGHAKVRGLLAGAGIHRHYRNYPDPHLDNWETAYFDDAYPRLQALKAKLDPHDRFRYPQSVKLPVK